MTRTAPAALSPKFLIKFGTLTPKLGEIITSSMHN
jgi:hypothetical protein